MENKKITVMQILPALNQGGVERGAIDLAKFLFEKNVNSIIVSSGGIWVDELKNSGVLHITMNVKTKNIFKMFLNSFKIKNLIKQYNVDIIHARSRAPAWSAYWATIGTKIKFITTFHGAGNLPKNPILRFFKKYYNSIMCVAIPTITPSLYTAEFLIKHYGINPCNLKVIHRWVDLEKFNKIVADKQGMDSVKKALKIPNNTKVIFCPSRFSRIKGVHILVEALSKIKGDFYCIISAQKLKTNDYLNEVNALIKKYKLENKVIIDTVLPDNYLTFPFAYITINSATTEETFGRTLVESLACGVPCIATSIGGPLEIIEQNKSGWFIKPNDVNDMANAIQNALDLSAGEYKKIQENCKKRAQFFSLVEKCGQTLSLYKELLSKKGWKPKC